MAIIVKIGQASIDENGKARGGKAGDQTAKELAVCNWYSFPWTTVIRPKDSKVAEKIASTMEKACKNDNIGYDQSQRTTLFTEAEKVKFDLSKITAKCETDCSALVSVCVNAAGIKVSKDMYTGNELAVLSGTNKFHVYTTKEYVSKKDNLKRGDILLGKGHTAVVVSVDGIETPAPQDNKTTVSNLDVAKNFDKKLSGTYKVTASALNMRSGANPNKPVIVVLPSNAMVRCYGYYNINGTTKWYYVTATVNRKQYTGYCSSTYLKRA